MRHENPTLAETRDRQGSRFERNLATFVLVAYACYWIYLSLVAPIGTVINGLLDDSFYYLQVARNLAAGLGSTFDGVEPTNGYHPLWMGWLVPIYALFSGDEAPLRAALVLGTAFGFGFVLSVYRILGKTAGAWAATAGLLLFAWPRFFGQTVTLLETSLLLFLHVTVIGLWIHWSQRDSRSPGSSAPSSDSPDSSAPIPPSRSSNDSSSDWHARNLESSGSSSPDMRVQSSPIRRSLIFGALLGLSCLARLDSVFLLIALALFIFIAWIRKRSFWPWDTSPSLWRVALPLATAALVVLPYLASNVLEFGHLQPVSGSMKSTFPRPDLTIRYLREFPEFALLCLLGIGYFIASCRRNAPMFVRILGAFGLAGFLHMAYTLLFMCWGVDRWHFGILIPIGVLGIPYLADRMMQRTKLGTIWVRRGLLAAGLVMAVAVQAYSLALRGGRDLDVTRHLAYWARVALPTDAVVAATDTGVFAYFSKRTTINLDGLINNYRYREMLRSGRFVEYLEERNVGYILDQRLIGNAAWIQGEYESRPFRIWFRPENRVAGQITLYRNDEVARIQTESRYALAEGDRVPNAIVLWRYRSE